MASLAKLNERPLVVKRRRRREHRVHYGGAWKVAYADFVTAMMAFFMLLWLIAQADTVKLQGLADHFSARPSTVKSTSGADSLFGGKQVGETANGQSGASTPATIVGEPTSRITADAADKAKESETEAAQRVLAEELMIALKDTPDLALTRQVAVTPSRYGLRIQLMDSAARPMFKTGTDVLFPYADGLLKNVAGRLARGNHRVAVEGHTDASGRADQNWQLSGLRANAARRALVAGGLTADRIAEVTALAGNEPLYPDQPDRPENRRITVVVLSERDVSPSDTTFRR